MKQHRREFLKRVGIGAGAAALSAGSGFGHSLSPPGTFFAGPSSPSPWDEVPRILARIRPPSFPARDFDITRFGAIGDNQTDNTEAFRNAIAAASRAGGGRVVVPRGNFVTGAIRLMSNINLHVAAGATIRFSRDSKRYPLVFTRWEGIELMNFSPFIYAFEQENIGITGPGTIDGNCDCDHWWPWKGRTNCGWKPGDPSQESDRARLFEMAERGVPVSERVFGEGHYLRPMFIQPYRCKNVLLEGFTLLNSPMWQVHPVLCTNVTVRGLNIRTSVLGPNTDGCDPESCTDVLIEKCFFSVGDDCIAINSGRNADGRRVNVPSQNIVIQDCHMKDGHGGVTIGSQISGGVRNVFARNCRMDSPQLDIAVRIKNNAMRGGVIENVFVRDIDVGQIAMAALAIDFFYEEGKAGKFTPVTRNVTIQNLKTNKAKYALYLRGFENAPIERIALVDCDFGGVEKPSVIENVRGLSFSNVRVNGELVEKAI